MPDHDPAAKDYYTLLGVERSAKPFEIRKAYLKLAIRYHPDKNPDNRKKAEAVFKRINNAHATLADPQKRSFYDRYGSAEDDSPQEEEVGSSAPGVTPEEALRMFSEIFGDDDPFLIFETRAPAPPPAEAGEGGPGFPVETPSQGKGCLPVGTLVLLKRVRTLPGINGKMGEVLSFDASSGRYTVLVQGDTGEVRLKRDNLQQIIECVEVLPTHEKGTLFDFDSREGKYKVGMGKRVVLVLPANLVLPVGTRVTLIGLSDAKFNGVETLILTVDKAAGRYGVEKMRVKFANVRA